MIFPFWNVDKNKSTCHQGLIGNNQLRLGRIGLDIQHRTSP